MMISVEAHIARSRAEYAEAYAGLLDDPRRAAEFERLMGLIDQSEKDYRAQGIEAIGEDIARLPDVRTVKERHYLESGWGPFRDGREILEDRPGEHLYTICRWDWWNAWPPTVYWTVSGAYRPGGPAPARFHRLRPSAHRRRPGLV